MKTTKAQKALIDAANLVIHQQNLFLDFENRRVINAHMRDGVPSVTDLYGGEHYPIEGNSWRNGSGHVVNFGQPENDALEKIKEYAFAHYDDGGWDVIVECWSDDQLRAEIRKHGGYAGAMRFIRQLLVGIWAERQADAENSRF